MKRKKKVSLRKVASLCYFLAAIANFVTASIYFNSQNTKNLGPVWLGLGGTMLCLGTVFLIKSNNEKKEENNNKGNKDENNIKKNKGF